MIAIAIKKNAISVLMTYVTIVIVKKIKKMYQTVLPRRTFNEY